MTTPTHSSNTMKTLLATGVSILWIGMANIASAADNHAHSHGEGELNIAIEDHDLVLEVKLPAADVVGFEKAPRDDVQKEKVARALASFETANAWFEPSVQAQCKLESAHASLVGMSTKTSKQMAESTGKSSHEHSHNHSDQHTNTTNSESTHSDFEGLMQFHCEAPDKLDALVVLLFKSFPGITELRVQMVTPTTQISRRLSPEAAVLTIKP